MAGSQRTNGRRSRVSSRRLSGSRAPHRPVGGADHSGVAPEARLPDLYMLGGHRERPVQRDLTGPLEKASGVQHDPAAEHPVEDWDVVRKVNMDAVFLLSQHFGRQMIERGRGKIINVASLLSYTGGITVPGYTASKHAVAGLTKALANEWAGQGVQVNAIAPGYFRTDNTQPLQDNEERANAISNRIPAGRWGEPGDLAGAVVFLAAPASDYVSGHVLVVDGGWRAR